MTSIETKSIQDNLPWSIRAAMTLLHRSPSLSSCWHYEPGVALLAIQKAWEQTGDHRYFEYIQHNIDEFIDETGNIRTYELKEYNLDQINEGKVLFLLHAQTGDVRYKKALFLLREQLRTHPRTQQGGFWHKHIYPDQMWLDGLYMYAPFLTQFAQVFDEPEGFDDVAHQVELFDRFVRDTETGLLYHAWDYAQRQAWADPQTGWSPNFWGRAIGWFMMALPDILEHFPREYPGRDLIIRVFNKTARAVLDFQDETTGAWYLILDQGQRPGNYLEASASCMLVYALSKGSRLGYLLPDAMQPARRGYRGILDQFIDVDERGWVNLHQICSVGGLGGTPYRDGSFEYYISEPVVSNDYKGFGPFIMASVEIEQADKNTDSSRSN